MYKTNKVDKYVKWLLKIIQWCLFLFTGNNLKLITLCYEILHRKLNCMWIIKGIQKNKISSYVYMFIFYSVIVQ